MALVIEDGSQVAGANSYITVAELRAFGLARSSGLPTPNEEAESLLVRAMDYIEGMRSRFQGKKTGATQPLQFPRKGLIIDDEPFPDNAIPNELKNGQAQLAIDIFAGFDPMASSDGREVLREKVDVIETEYAQSSGSGSGPSIPKTMAFLEPLFGFNGATLRTIRG